MRWALNFLKLKNLTVTPDSEPPSYSQVISETSRENDNDTLNAGESIEEVILVSLK